MTTLAMPLTLNGPVPKAPAFSLLNTPGVVVPGDEDHWQAGATIYPYPVDTPETWEPCSVGTFRVKGDGAAVPLPAFSPFAVWLAVTCTALGMGIPQEFQDRAEIALDAVLSFGVANALSQGVIESPNPFFLDGNEDLPAGSTAQKPIVGLSYLENAIGASGRQGLIHATPAIASSWGITENDSSIQGLTTKAGTRVAVDGGYQGAHRIGHTAPPAGQEWAFATGPVQVRYESETRFSIDQVLDRSNNDTTFRAERYVLAYWDTAVQSAVLVDWTQT